jgi:hypothetical protein
MALYSGSIQPPPDTTIDEPVQRQVQYPSVPASTPFHDDDELSFE